ncbi:MAG: LacI family DNA-binding transcriptional regulator [Cucumibacter sp.]
MTGIRQLADHLNISIGTVSRALNDKPDVREETRKRVLAAAQELGYFANHSGRSLRKGTTNTAGFMIELDPQTAVNSDNFFMGVFDGVKRALSPVDMDLVILPCSTDERPSAFLRRMVARGIVEGVILSATLRNDDRIEFLRRAQMPFVALGRTGISNQFSWIDLDFEGFVRQSVDRLAAFGHQRIAIAVPESEINLRYVLERSYRREMKRRGLSFPTDYLLRTDSVDRADGTLGDRLLALAPRPTAIILGYELMALGLYHRLEALGIVPGRDLSIIGLRESPQSMSLFPRLTCFRIDLPKLGHALGAALLRSIPAHTVELGRHTATRWPMQLVPGDSDGPV